MNDPQSKSDEFDLQYSLKEDTATLKRAIAKWEKLHDEVQRFMAELNKHYNLGVVDKHAVRVNIDHRGLVMADLYRKIGEKEIP